MMPSLTIFIPMLLLFSTRYIEVPFGAAYWNMIIAQTVAMHSPLNTVAVLLSTRRYRQAFLGMFKKISGIWYRPKRKSGSIKRRIVTPK
ncbi:unnamed protein product [Strongylus vulgaris]|uniref:G-protein coupled receptors family 1 profile domain-containing protein n=1 Tax=Strongylus vulgaris TaxID=40348 RepID=A0A3P7IH03_STRVU|nr:unnamed protein product [Strongylus vulgaris]